MLKARIAPLSHDETRCVLERACLRTLRAISQLNRSFNEMARDIYRREAHGASRHVRDGDLSAIALFMQRQREVSCIDTDGVTVACVVTTHRPAEAPTPVHVSAADGTSFVELYSADSGLPVVVNFYGAHGDRDPDSSGGPAMRVNNTIRVAAKDIYGRLCYVDSVAVSGTRVAIGTGTNGATGSLEVVDFVRGYYVFTKAMDQTISSLRWLGPHHLVYGGDGGGGGVTSIIDIRVGLEASIGSYEITSHIAVHRGLCACAQYNTQTEKYSATVFAADDTSHTRPFLRSLAVIEDTGDISALALKRTSDSRCVLAASLLGAVPEARVREAHVRIWELRHPRQARVLSEAAGLSSSHAPAWGGGEDGAGGRLAAPRDQYSAEENWHGRPLADPLPSWEVTLMCELQPGAGVVAAIALHGCIHRGLTLVTASLPSPHYHGDSAYVLQTPGDSVTCWDMRRLWKVGDPPLTEPDARMPTPPGTCVALVAEGNALIMGGGPVFNGRISPLNLPPPPAAFKRTFIQSKSWAVSIRIGGPLD